MTLGPFWVSFLLKILVTAAVVIAAARTAERAGPFFGALIACLPVSAGPSYVLLSLQASDGFIAETALASAAVTRIFRMKETQNGPSIMRAVA